MTAVAMSHSQELSSAPRRDVLAGGAGLVFLALIVMQNVIRPALGPGNVASAEELSVLTHADAWSVHLFMVAFALGFPAVIAFAEGVARWCIRKDPRTGTLAGMGRASVAVIAALIAVVNAIQVVLVAGRDHLAPSTAELLWTVHTAVFTLNMIAIGTALLGLGLAAVRAGLIARWMGPVTAVGGSLLIVAAMPAVPVVQGSAWLAVGLMGFVIWMLFLAVTATALLRRDPVAAPARW